MTRMRLAPALLMLTVGLLIQPVFSQVLRQPASIVITTDGTSATIETSGGDVGYPGPSQVTIERDALGYVITSRQRLFVPLEQRVYLPGVVR